MEMTTMNTIFDIPEENYVKFKKEIDKLSRRSLKLTGEEIYVRVCGDYYKDDIKFIKVEFDFSPVKLDGWQFVATLDHTPEGNIIRSVPNTGIDIPVKYRDCSPNCDHCNINRRRNDTYLVCDELGEFKQVGSSCLIDFFGHDPFKIVKRAELVGYAAEVARAYTEYNISNISRRYIGLEIYLSFVASVIRRNGWVSAAQARIDGSRRTASIAMEGYFGGYDIVNDADRECARKAIEWVRSLSTEEIDNSDYLHNISVVAKSEYIEPRTTGLAAAIVYSYQRAAARERAMKTKANVGDMAGIIALFEQAKKSKLKAPAFILVTKDSRGDACEIRLNMAGSTARVPGSINVTTNGSYENRVWFGRVHSNGVFETSRNVAPEGLVDTLKAFANDPAGVAAEFGKLTGRCCCCGKSLSVGESTNVGYGKRCAEKMGWPYGKTYKMCEAA